MNRLEFSSLINCFVWFSLSFSSFLNEYLISFLKHMVGSLKMNTALEYSTRVVQEVDRRCQKSTLNDLAYLTPLRIPLMNPVIQLLCFMRRTKISVQLCGFFF